MYSVYLYLIMLTEALPRGTPADDDTLELVTNKLSSELAALSASFPS